MANLSDLILNGYPIVDWRSPTAITDTANLTFNSYNIVTVTAADKTLTLPQIASSADYGKMIVVGIAASTTKLITIDGYGTGAGDYIDGAANRVMWASEFVQLVATANGWIKVGGKTIPMAAIIRRNGNQTINNNTETIIQYNELASQSVTGMTDIASTYRINVLRPCIAHVVLAIYFEGTSLNTMTTSAVATRIFVNTSQIAGLDGSGFTWASSAFNAVLPTQYNCAAGDYIQGRVQHWNGASRTLGPYNTLNRLEFIEVPTW